MNPTEFEARRNDEMQNLCRRIARDGMQGTARRIQQLEGTIEQQMERIAMLERQVACLESNEAVQNLLAMVERLEAENHQLRATASQGVIYAASVIDVQGDLNL